MYYFGIDWSQDHLNLCILNPAGVRVSQLEFAPTPPGLSRIEAERSKLEVEVSACPVAIETASHLVVDYLLEHAYAVYIVPPTATRGYRQRQRATNAHTDTSDAAVLADALRTDRASLRRWEANSALLQQLAAQVRLVESLERSIHRQANQLRALLLRTFPSAPTIFSELTTQLALQFLAAYPTASEAQALTRDAFGAFCAAHGDTRPKEVVKRYARLTQALPTPAPSVVAAYREPVRVLSRVLLPQVQAHAAARHHLSRLFQQHSDAPLFASLPGAGDFLGPALLVKFGDVRTRFPSAAVVQALAGTCPVTEQSGKSRHVYFRQGCDKAFRRIVHLFARASLNESSWALAYWQEIRPGCASDVHALRVLGNRWLAIIWQMWQTQRPYDEAYHLRQRATRRRPKA